MHTSIQKRIKDSKQSCEFPLSDRLYANRIEITNNSAKTASNATDIFSTLLYNYCATKYKIIHMEGTGSYSLNI